MPKRSEPRQPVLSELAATWVKLGAREKLVLVHVAERLLIGQQAYGLLTPKKKAWRKETSEELLDATVYLTCALIDEKES